MASRRSAPQFPARIGLWLVQERTEAEPLDELVTGSSLSCSGNVEETSAEQITSTIIKDWVSGLEIGNPNDQGKAHSKLFQFVQKTLCEDKSSARSRTLELYKLYELSWA
jgi:hypothetical protein